MTAGWFACLQLHTQSFDHMTRLKATNWLRDRKRRRVADMKGSRRRRVTRRNSEHLSEIRRSSPRVSTNPGRYVDTRRTDTQQLQHSQSKRHRQACLPVLV